MTLQKSRSLPRAHTGWLARGSPLLPAFPEGACARPACAVAPAKPPPHLLCWPWHSILTGTCRKPCPGGLWQHPSYLSLPQMLGNPMLSILPKSPSDTWYPMLLGHFLVSTAVGALEARVEVFSMRLSVTDPSGWGSHAGEERLCRPGCGAHL